MSEVNVEEMANDKAAEVPAKVDNPMKEAGDIVMKGISNGLESNSVPVVEEKPNTVKEEKPVSVEEEKLASVAPAEVNKEEQAAQEAEVKKVETTPDVVEPMTTLDKKIIKQVEYYFGDANLTKDKFLQEQIKKDDGWVSLEVLCTFNRLKQLSSDRLLVAKALRKSTTSLMEVSDDNKSLRRNPLHPLPELNPQRKRDLAARSIYTKRFPVEASLEELEEFFTKFGAVEQVTMRKNIRKEFKGSVFVLFGKKEGAENFLQKESVQYEGTELEVRLPREEHYSNHVESVKQAKEEEQRKTEELLAKEMEDKLHSKMVKGTVLKVTGLAASNTQEQVKEFFTQYIPVKWVDLDKKALEALVRFHGEDSAQKAWEKAKEETGKDTLDANDLEGSVLEGEEELEHWRHILQQGERVRGFKGQRGGRNNRGRDRSQRAPATAGPRSGNRGQKRGHDARDVPQAKMFKA